MSNALQTEQDYCNLGRLLFSAACGAGARLKAENIESASQDVLEAAAESGAELLGISRDTAAAAMNAFVELSDNPEQEIRETLHG